MIAIVAAAVLVSAAAAVGVVLLGGGDDRAPRTGETSEPAAGPTSDQDGDGGDEKGSGGDPRDPRRGIQNMPDPVVADDWQVVTSAKRYLAFDVPPDWKVDSPGTIRYWEDEAAGDGSPTMGLSATTTFMEGWCGHGSRAVEGTRGAQGSTGTAEAAEVASGNLVWAAYDQAKAGTFELGDAEPFSNEHGIEGHVAVAAAHGSPLDDEDECDANQGRSVAIAYLDARADLAVWGLVADTGHDEELTDELIDQIISSLRPYND
ncbi:hypothetical protein GCM10009716_11880 [Streptomyces sodiiphilus]|uniref:DUF8017 domain-containing protein n=1 Tax=Streptomyces sodiiphilus TaxID=226217 RepID=A0ABN2NWV8_9ACTN